MRHFRLPCIASLAAIAFLVSLSQPTDLWAFWDEDTLKTSGIAIGIALGVCLVVVLIAGTMKDIHEDEEEEEEEIEDLARFVLPHTGASGCGYSLLAAKSLFRKVPAAQPESALLLRPLVTGRDAITVDPCGEGCWSRIPGRQECRLEKVTVPGYPDGGQDPVPLLPMKVRTCPARAEAPHS